MDGKQQGSVGCDDGQERGVSEVEGKTRFRPCRGPERSRDTLLRLRPFAESS